jgi:hypothetical protein
MKVIVQWKSLNRTLRKLALPEYRPIFLSPCRTILCKGGLTKPVTPPKLAIFLGPSAGQFREVSLYSEKIVKKHVLIEIMWN